MYIISYKICKISPPNDRCTCEMIRDCIHLEKKMILCAYGPVLDEN
jgi:hypothetical protein